MLQGNFFWKKVETFIGRDKVVDDLIAMLQDDAFHLVPISGDYGYGKTRLLLQILKLARQKHKEIALPRGIIDLYQTDNHSPEGLAEALVNNFPSFDFYFTEYAKHKKMRDQARVAGNVQKGKEAIQNMLNACAEGLTRLSYDHGVLILLDTAERWVYPSLEGSPFTQHAAPSWEWLKLVCANLSRSTVIIAGRKETSQLGFAPHPIIYLPPFSEEDTREYITKTARLFKNAFKTAPVTFSEHEIQTLCMLSEGRPILLALFLERIAHGDERIRHAAATSSPKEFEALLIKRLMEDAKIGSILRVVGRAPRGVNLELLTMMTDLPQVQLKEGFEILKGMSFAKTFAGNNRLFLHEEMYAMLARNVYEKDGDNSEADQAAYGLYTYYKMHTGRLNREIGGLYVEYAETEKKGEKKKLWGKIDTTAKELQMLNTDFAYYRWQRMIKPSEDPLGMGLRRYYRIAHEAATSNDIEMLVLLRFELIRFIKKMIEEAQSGAIKPWLSFFQGFLVIQEIWETNASGQSWNIAVDIETRLSSTLKSIPNLTPIQNVILVNLLNVWRGMSLLYMNTANYPAAELVFNESITALENISIPETSSENQSLNWFLKATIALAYRQRAYLDKRQGYFDAAVSDYQGASLASRWLDYSFEEATIRNDLGDTQVLTGLLDDSHLNLKDAFELRQKMKNGARLALSYSTLSRYFIARGAYAQAREYATLGMNLSNMVGRGTAFARVAWAEATRRYASESGSNKKRKIELLNQAESAALEALEGLTEPALQIDALVELGCIYRDRMRNQPPTEVMQADFKKSDDLLLEVKKLASEQGPPNYYRLADAMTNRIWMGLFVENTDFALQAARDFEQLGIFGFDITQQGVFQNEAHQMAKSDKKPILQFIGKYYIALGTLELGPDGRLDEEKINKIARQWMLGLEYSVLFASSYRGLEAARQTVYNKIKKFNQDELKLLTSHVNKAEQDEKITNSELQKLMKQNSFWFEA